VEWVIKENSIHSCFVFSASGSMECRTNLNTERSPDIPPVESICWAAADMFALNMAIEDWVEPKHPVFATEASRLSSYENWPHQMNPSPDSLSEEGFFHTGKSCCKYINL
jgi:hypothetical protein